MSDDPVLEEEEPDPGDVKNVFLVTFHVVETFAGTFSATAYDPMGGVLAQAPLVPDAKDWGDALALFWIAVREKAMKINKSGSN